MRTDNDISIETFLELGWLSLDATIVCEKNSLKSFIELVELFRKHSKNLNFLNECTPEIQYELNTICSQFEKFSIEEIVVEINNFFSFLSLVDFAKEEIKSILDRHVTKLILSISVRARNGLYGLFKSIPSTDQLIYKIYAPQFSFLKIKNMGVKSVNELEIFKEDLFLFVNQFKEYLGDKINDDEIELPIIEFNSTLDLIEKLSPHKKLTLNRHIEYLISKLQVRSRNAISSFIDEPNNKKLLLTSIFSPSFSFSKLINVGSKTISELDFFKVGIDNYVKEIQNLKEDELSKEFSILVLKSSFKNFIGINSNIFEGIFEKNGKIKLFKLIQVLINSGHIFKKHWDEVFRLEFTEDYTKDIFQITEELKLTKERLRQIKKQLKNSFQTNFAFILNFKIDDLQLYDILNTEVFKVVDYNFIRKINSNEDVNFNINFYCKILDILIEDSFSIIGIDPIKINLNSTLRSCEFKNKYLIIKKLYFSFNFINFIIDVDSKLSDRITETYEFHFEGYLFQFLTTNEVSCLGEIKVICENILYNEFQLVIDETGYLNFERNTYKQVYEYCYEILERNSQKMTINEIQNVFNEQYPDLLTKTDTIRGSLNREKEFFIYYGRSSTYGLRKWEQEKENHKGGTIRDIVEEFLINEEQPKHIIEILKHVEKYRNTNKRSVLTNLKVDESNRFVFFKKEYVGVTSKVYDPNYFASIEKKSKSNWNDKVNIFKLFIEQNNGKLPSAMSSELLERSLYLFMYKTRKSFKKNELSKEKMNLLKKINFPFWSSK